MVLMIVLVVLAVKFFIYLLPLILLLLVAYFIYDAYKKKVANEQPVKSTKKKTSKVQEAQVVREKND